MLLSNFELYISAKKITQRKPLQEVRASIEAGLKGPGRKWTPGPLFEEIHYIIMNDTQYNYA